jgi:hypothetical protein
MLKSFLVSIVCVAFCPFLKGNEIFSMVPDYQLKIQNLYSMTSGDINNDGKNDLIVCSLTHNKKYKITIFYNKEGTLKTGLKMEIEYNFNSPISLKIGDFDNDKKNDIAANEYKTLHLFLGKDLLQKNIFNYDVNNTSTPVYPVKISNTGNCDFISSGVYRKWLKNGKWVNGYIFPPEKQSSNRLCIPADLNSDGQMDIVALPKAGNDIRLYYGPFCTMRIKPKEVSKFYILNFENPKYIAVGQLNSDCNPDIAVTNFEKTGIFYQAQPIDFSEENPSVIIDSGGPPVITDFNNDKKNDLAVLDAQKRKIFIFLQKANGSFTKKSMNADCFVPITKTSSFHFCDINGDNLVDMIVSDGASKINIHLNKNK